MMSYFSNIFTPHGSFAFPALLALAAAKATLLLAFAALLCFAFRRLSAATRHLLWSSALCASLLLPFLSFIKMWEVSILPAQMMALSSRGAQALHGEDEVSDLPEARATQDFSRPLDAVAGLEKEAALQTKAGLLEVPAPAPNMPESTESQASRRTQAASFLSQLVDGALAVWTIGVLLFLLKLLAGFIATNLLTRRATQFEDPSMAALFSTLLLEVDLKRKVRLLRSERMSMPIVYGILRPAVLLPAEAEAWTDERRRMVLLHELTHVTRRDCLTQLLAQIACAFYWFNPFIWFAARRLRVEREQACDDYVLSIGTKPSDYANHLLEIARSMQERSIFEWTQTTSVAMARRSQLEGRLLAILSKENKRGAVSRALTSGLLTLICLLLLSLAAIHPTVIQAQNPRTSPHASPDEKEDRQKSPTDSFATDDARREVGAVAQGAATHEASEKQDAVAIDSPQARTLNDAQVGKGIGPNIQGELERNVVQEGVAEVVRQSNTGAQMPESKPLTNQEASPFINAGHRQDSSPQTQKRSGDFIDEMASVGYTNLSIDELIRLKTAGVSADYVRSLRALGLANLTSKEIATLSIHGVNAAYIQSIRSAGYNDLSAKELSNFRIHDITPEYIRTLRDAGYGNLAAKQLTEFAIHRVTPAFISGIRAAGFGNLSPKELVSLRVYDITPEFIRKSRSRLGDLTIKQLISLKNMGILKDEKGKEKNKE
jgi:beta-lactamase regulating signal transducer with metallopeptidase domain